MIEMLFSEILVAPPVVDGTWEDHARIPRTRTSPLLNAILFKHRVGNVPRDGNCFYSACSHALRMCDIAYTEPLELRSRVTNEQTDDERELSALVDTTGSGWADHVQICACARLFDILIVVVDDDHLTLSLHGNLQTRTSIIVVRLANAHYEPVLCRDPHFLLSLFPEGCDCLTHPRLLERATFVNDQHCPRQTRLYKFVHSVRRFLTMKTRQF